MQSAEFLNKKLNPAAKSTVRPLNILPSPTASSERRKVVSMEKDPALPSFSQLDGVTTPSPTPRAPPSHPCPPAPFDKPCAGDLNSCGSKRKDPTSEHWETRCDKCWRHLCTFNSIMQKCSVNCNIHHCHKSSPGGDFLWGFKDKGCKIEHQGPCFHCRDWMCHCMNMP